MANVETSVESSSEGHRIGRESLAEMSLVEHLTELRYRLFVSVIAVFLGAILCWFVSDRLFEILSIPVTRVLEQRVLAAGEAAGSARLVILALTEAFVVYVKVAAVAGLFLASPIFIAQAWLFVAPGLYSRERRLAVPVIGASVVFFIAGGAFGYFVLFPVMAQFFVTLAAGQFRPMLSANSLFGFLMRTLVGCAVVFEWPIVVFFLARLGLVTARAMLRGFRYAVLAIFVIAAVITPTPDMATQTILALPMLGLYAIGILIAWAVQPRDG